jgi:hypothetical protein
MHILGFIIVWISFSWLFGFYDVEHNILAAFCFSLFLDCVTSIGNRSDY